MLGTPAPGSERWLAVEGGSELPAAFNGLRAVLRALQDAAPEAVERQSERYPVEWNRLFPGSFPGAPGLPDIALSPSERRLHRESEQVFRTLLAASRVIVDACAEARLGVAVADAGRWDLVSLRGLALVAERTRSAGGSPVVVVDGWDVAGPRAACRFPSLREQQLPLVRARLDGPRAPPGGRVAAGAAGGAAGDGEIDVRSLRDSIAAHLDPPERLAAAVAAVRSGFFSTNYEGALLAADGGLEALERAAPCPPPGVLARALEARDDGLASPAMEVDPELLDGAAQLRAFFLKAAGVVHALVGDDDLALKAFGEALDSSQEPVQRAQLHMFRALVLSKRLQQPGAARDEIDAGLAQVRGRQDAAARRERGWLHNVGGLIRFMGGQLGRALDDERLALDEIRSLSDPSATHLKINLISNLSVLQESAHRFDEALRTWQRFTRISDSWNDNFAKHHTYRSAGLLLEAGRTGEAVECYRQVYDIAGRLGDCYHQHVVACELGTLALRRDERDRAAERFGEALRHAGEVGDPYWVAQSLVGMALSRAGPATRLLADARVAAGASRVRAGAARELQHAIGSGDRDALAAVLPAPRSKLNRPFDLVNLP